MTSATRIARAALLRSLVWYAVVTTALLLALVVGRPSVPAGPVVVEVGESGRQAPGEEPPVAPPRAP